MNLGSLRMFFKKGDQRTILLKKNILASVVLKGISMLISLFIVPITINYVNPVQYGIWLTLSSLMAWFYFFDIGLTNGFRNRFTTLKACGKLKMARVYVSTTYAALFISFVVFMSVMIPVSFIVDWSSVLKVDQSYCEELRMTICGSSGIFRSEYSFSDILDHAYSRPAVSLFVRHTGVGPGSCVTGDLHSDQDCQIRFHNLTCIHFFRHPVCHAGALLNHILQYPLPPVFARISATYGSNM